MNKLLLVSIAAALIVGAAERVHGDDPISSHVRYTGEIVRIFDRKCAPCHGADAVAVPLSNYREVRDWSRAIREEIVEQRMPPWSVARGYGRFRNQLALTARETATILSWLDGGMPRGEDRDLPRRAAASSRKPPDLRLSLPPQQVPALDEHVVRRVTVETGLTTAHSLSQIVVTSANRRLLRGALVFVENGGRAAQWIGGWLPWQPEIAAPRSHGFHLAPGARITVELQYRGGREAAQDRPTLDLYFANAKPVGELLLDGTLARLAAPTRIWAIVPSSIPSSSGTPMSVELTARQPDGTVEMLLWMPEFHHEWPHALVLDQPVSLPAGTTLSLSAQPPGSAAARLSLLR